MKSSGTSRFWAAYYALPVEVRQAARKQYKLWAANPAHPSLQFKKIGQLWSVRITGDYRALALLRGDTYHWFWIGTPGEYDRILK